MNARWICSEHAAKFTWMSLKYSVFCLYGSVLLAIIQLDVFFSISIHFSFCCCRFFMRWISLLFRFWASACILGNHAMIAFRSELRARCSHGRPQFFTFQTIFIVDYSLNEVSFGAINSGHWRAHGQHMGNTWLNSFQKRTNFIVVLNRHASFLNLASSLLYYVWILIVAVLESVWSCNTLHSPK